MSRTPRFYYGYVIVAVAFVIQIAAWGTFNAYGVFFPSLLEDFGWSRATISGAFSVSQFVIGVSAIFLGGLNDRFGPRLLMTACGFVLGAGYLMMSQVHSVWMLYLYYGLIIGIGLSGPDVVLLSTASRWFTKNRGIMVGIVKVGTGVAIMILPPLINWLIGLQGWRATYAYIGVALFCVVVAGAQFLRRDPGQRQRRVAASAAAASYPPLEPGLDLEQSMKTRRFWMLSLAYFTIFFCSHSIIVHTVKHTEDLGLTAAFGAIVLSIIGGSSIAGRLGMGAASDKIGSKRALIICFVILVVGLLWLLFARTVTTFVVFATIYGFAHGGFFVLNSTAVADFFGTRAHGLILGTLIFSGSVGGAIGPFITGYIFDLTDSYRLAFILLLTLAVAGLTMISSAEPPGPEINQRT